MLPCQIETRLLGCSTVKLNAAAAGLTAIIESLPDPSHFAAAPAITEAEALAITGCRPFSPGLGAREPARLRGAGRCSLSSVYSAEVELYGFALKHKWSAALESVARRRELQRDSESGINRARSRPRSGRCRPDIDMSDRHHIGMSWLIVSGIHIVPILGSYTRDRPDIKSR